MVLLAMTPTITTAVKIYLKSESVKNISKEPPLQNPAEGNPISHDQLIDLSRFLKSHSNKLFQNANPLPVHLSELLQGCSIYFAAPPSKSEKSAEYKELMTRLRKEEEARSYSKMLNPSTSFSDAYSPSNDINQSTADEDDMTYSDVNRQMALVLNVLISIIACGIAIWIAARHWSTPPRLALSMLGSAVVGVAEVVIYSGYIRRLKEAKTKERKKVEERRVADTWVISGASTSTSTGKVPKSANLSGPRLRRKS